MNYLGSWVAKTQRAKLVMTAERPTPATLFPELRTLALPSPARQKNEWQARLRQANLWRREPRNLVAGCPVARCSEAQRW